MSFVTTQDGTEVYYRDWGTGAPVVLIHGWPVTMTLREQTLPSRLIEGSGLTLVEPLLILGATEPPLA